MKKKPKPQSTEFRLKSVENRLDTLEQIVRGYEPRNKNFSTLMPTTTWIDPRIKAEGEQC